MFLLFYATTNGLGGSPKLSLSPGAGKPGYATASSVVCFLRSAFMSVAAIMLQIEMLFGIYVVVFNFVETSTKNYCKLPCNEMSLFCYIARSFSNRHHCVPFTLQLIWGNVIFVSVVARVFTLSFLPRIVLNKLKTSR